jgi:hypothetical protein
MAKFSQEILIDDDDDDNQFAWKLRYFSIKSIVNMRKILNNKENEDFCQTCWACLIVLQENEKNSNVLEALKVGQVIIKFI